MIKLLYIYHAIYNSGTIAPLLFLRFFSMRAAISPSLLSSRSPSYCGLLRLYAASPVCVATFNVAMWASDD